jgi:hypothetical protein
MRWRCWTTWIALSATSALAALVQQGRGKVEHFEQVASKMLPLYPGISVLILAPGGIGGAAPLAGNEKAIGLNLFQDTVMKEEALLARNSGRLTLAGPLELVQGALLRLENALRRALERDQLRLHYQPQRSLRTGTIIGVQALLRWQHPEQGSVSPEEFIPIAASSGQIQKIGEWVLRSAVAQARQWQELGLPEMTMCVNLSAVQFRHPDLPELVTTILAECGWAPRLLALELTEGVALHDPLARSRCCSGCTGVACVFPSTISAPATRR